MVNLNDLSKFICAFGPNASKFQQQTIFNEILKNSFEKIRDINVTINYVTNLYDKDNLSFYPMVKLQLLKYSCEY